jgi:catechol 2,3-dioxygenase-like lactoylglutathione lyase family enzyme
MIDHVSIRVSNLQQSKNFYRAVLEALGYSMIKEEEAKAAFRGPGGAGVWLRKDDFVSSGVHVAFRAQDKKAVDRCYEAGLAHGGTDNGAPGPRPHREDQHVAFLHDPDGNNIEVVYRPAVE